MTKYGVIDQCQHCNGLLPDGIKKLPEPVLTYHQRCSVTFVRGQCHKKYVISQSINSAWNLMSKISRLIGPSFYSKICLVYVLKISFCALVPKETMYLYLVITVTENGQTFDALKSRQNCILPKIFVTHFIECESSHFDHNCTDFSQRPDWQ